MESAIVSGIIEPPLMVYLIGMFLNVVEPALTIVAQIASFVSNEQATSGRELTDTTYASSDVGWKIVTLYIAQYQPQPGSINLNRT